MIMIQVGLDCMRFWCFYDIVFLRAGGVGLGCVVPVNLLHLVSSDFGASSASATRPAIPDFSRSPNSATKGF